MGYYRLTVDCHVLLHRVYDVFSQRWSSGTLGNVLPLGVDCVCVTVCSQWLKSVTVGNRTHVLQYHVV